MCVLHDQKGYEKQYIQSNHGYMCDIYLSGSPGEKTFLTIEYDNAYNHIHDIINIPITYCPLCGKSAYEAWQQKTRLV